MRVTEDDLRINKDDLDTEVIRQPELFYHAAKAYADAVNVRDSAKKQLENERVIQDERIRRELTESGEKVTENIVSAAVERSSNYQQALGIFIHAKHNADLASALQDAFHQRSFVLRDLVSLHIAGYYGDASAKVPAHTRHTEDETAKRRKTINKKRKRVRVGYD